MNNTCYWAVDHFSSFYENHVHSYLCLAICIVGSVFNIINIVVFTRKNMVSPTNVVLTWLAVADLALLLLYIPITFGHSKVYSDRQSPTILHAVIYLTRFISIWMTLVLAVWRYLAILHPMKARNWCNMKITYRTVVAVYLLCSLIYLPHNIIKTDFLSQFWASFSDIVFIWCFCMIPCFTLPILTLRLVYTLWKVKKRHRKLIPSPGQPNARDTDTENQMNRTSLMLVVVTSLFLLTMEPYKISFLLDYIITEGELKFHVTCFRKLDEFFVMLMILDAATNFVVYYFMSSQFRKTCHILFNCNKLVIAENVLRIRASDEVTTERTPV